MSSEATELNDLSIHEMLVMLDAETVRSLIDYYIDETRNRIPKMRTLFDKGDLAGLIIEAHSLKGASRTYGAKGIGGIAFRLEEACKNKNTADAGKWLGEIEAGCEPSIAALLAFLESEVKS